jgi:hypothetical protein
MINIDLFNQWSNDCGFLSVDLFCLGFYKDRSSFSINIIVLGVCFDIEFRRKK